MHLYAYIFDSPSGADSRDDSIFDGRSPFSTRVFPRPPLWCMGALKNMRITTGLAHKIHRNRSVWGWIYFSVRVS